MAAKSASVRLIAAKAEQGRLVSASAAMLAVLRGLRSRRIAMGYSQQDMAGRLSMTRETFCRLENGERPTDTDTLFRWAALLGGRIAVTFSVTPNEKNES